jgi:HD-GYP domain-containing protein (c-di-GMP phosphodiesterase class II)
MEILVGQPEFSLEALNIVGSHHERFDGSGYPRRIQGDKISLHAELAGLIDSYCAMTRQRAYCSAVSSQQALEQLIHMRGTKFRAPIVDQLIQCIGLYPIGSLVELNSGEVGVVIQQNQVRRLKPRIMVVLAPDKSVERRPRTLDLIMNPAGSTGDPYRILRSLPMDAYGINPADFYLG